ncbi:M24 family metallopeptidase [Thermoanaerobacterium sp. DL9XJH110]|uniref:M24 family metallopeptidase n=1 Tax=Thermoanaerobacterium sp. DL9XJH110 TaxID=3386643 RepID=UPI003BB74966
MIKRIESLLDILEKEKLDGLLLIKEPNIRYISGFTGSESYTVVSSKGRAFITDSRYTEQAEQECHDFEVVRWRSPFPELQDVIKEVCEKYGIKRLGFEKDAVTIDLYEKFKKALSNIEFVPTLGLVEGLRYVKDSGEIECIKKAAQIADAAFEELLKSVKPGITEKDIELELQYLIKKKGASDIGFPIIVASGARGSLPHAIPSEKKIEFGDFVTVDFGALYNGYRSDCTRTFGVGRLDEKQKEIYNIVKNAQHVGVESLKPGISGKDPDKNARSIIEKAGYGENFGHGLGHGVGLEIHEQPFMSSNCDKTILAGNVITVEPGIYIPGWGGVRIEDSVLVTENGPEILTKTSKELIII